MDLEASWNQIEEGLADLVEGRQGALSQEVLSSLEHLGFVDTSSPSGPTPTSHAHRYHLARFVRQEDDAVEVILQEVLVEHTVPNGFCETLWPVGEVPKDGAIRLMMRLLPSSSETSSSETSSKRWLELMNKAGLITYNRASPTVRVLYNPSDLAPPEDEADREKNRAHLLSPDTPFQNLLSLKEILRATRDWIRWYERHLPGDVLEVLHREIPAGQVQEILLLSGPANVDAHVQDNYLRARREWQDRRGISLTWKILSHRKSGNHHDRFLLSKDFARNLPPLNSILSGSTSEITASNLTVEEFDEWWDAGEDLADRQFDS